MNHPIIRLLSILLLVSSASAQVSVREDSLYSPSIRHHLPYTILLPDGYSRTKERYPVLYLLHGFNQNHLGWHRNTHLVELAARFPCIIILPEGWNRWYTNSVNASEWRMEDAFVKDLVPYVDSVYRTVRERGGRAVAGLSMGGYGALKYGIKYPQLFCLAGGLSPSIQFPVGLEDSAIVARRSAATITTVKEAFGAERNPQWMENDIPSLLEGKDGKELPFFYLAVGSQDIIPEVITQAHALAGSLRKKKAHFEMHESEGGHDWMFWDQQTEMVLSVFQRLRRH